ncbi:hypothetical protein N7450_011461 [Penicillium hetheringtonii]|uniref:Histidine phosphatase family protein n=1 Tax=Penicillium hetheringtonii TaxID=911720 RepID=A0AAD6DA28_9EURO|nr:hypothetical protein N7450_011461 [Penicillium hetheringtonii]
MDARIFIVRHGETEWSANNRYTGTRDIPLTLNGEKEAVQAKDKFVGPKKLIEVANLRAIYCSPLARARRTAEILFPKVRTDLFKLDEGLREWDYGNFEGLTPSQIKKSQLGESSTWDLWLDGCPDGEVSLNIKARLDALILKIKEDIQGSSKQQDIVCVTHRHIAIALALLLTGIPFQYGSKFAIETAGIMVLHVHQGSLDRIQLSLAK